MAELVTCETHAAAIQRVHERVVARPCNRCKEKNNNDLLCDENPQNRSLKVGQVKQLQKVNNRRQNNKNKHNKQ